MSNVPAGWYPDPAGSPQQRWWDGSNWSETLQPVPQQPNPYQSQGAYGASQPYGSVQPYQPMQSYAGEPNGGAPYYSASGLSARAGTNPNTAQAWIIALWPLLNLVSLVIGFLLGAYAPVDMLYSTNGGITTVDIISSGFSFVGWLAFIAIASSDYRELVRRGVPKPFHWAFAIIPFPIVYVIGRATTVYSRTRTGLAPLFVWIGAVAVSIIASLATAIGIAMSMTNSGY